MFDPADHRVRYRGWWRVTATCSCGWVHERTNRRDACWAWRAHVILDAADVNRLRRRRVELRD